MQQNGNNNQNLNINEIKQKLADQMPGVDVNNISTNDIKNMIVHEINNNKNINIDDSVKEKINSGDIDGLKEDIIKYLSKSNDANTQQIIGMLKNNDMEGLQKQLMGMLLGGMGQQKKNEINENVASEVAFGQEEGSFAGFDVQGILNVLTEKMFAGAKDDKRVIFLNSIKPFLSEMRQKSIDDCIRVLNLVVFFENFNNNAGR